MSEDSEQPIIIKKIVKGGGHHGGAWKVAYADFVTAMMAFFLLLWLLNVTTEEQKNAISNYFDPTPAVVSESTSGAGGVMGGLSMSPQGAMVSKVQPITSQNTIPATNNTTKKGADNGDSKDPKKMEEEALREELQKREEEQFKAAEEAIKQAIEETPELAEMAKNLIVDMTPEGLRIQIVDQEGDPMFPSGSANMYEKTRKLITKISEIIVPMPNEISVRGHTDSTPYGPGANYTNWELSSDRANASRRVMLEAGYPIDKMNNVMGKADTEHLFADEPTDARNRRISIILLKQELTDPDFYKKAAERRSAQGTPSTPSEPPKPAFEATPGKVTFP